MNNKNNKQDIVPIIVFIGLIVVALVLVVFIIKGFSKDISNITSGLDDVKNTISETKDNILQEKDTEPTYEEENILNAIGTDAYNYEDDYFVSFASYLYDSNNNIIEERVVDIDKQENTLLISIFGTGDNDYVDYAYFDVNKEDLDKIRTIYNLANDIDLADILCSNLLTVNNKPIDMSKSVLNYIRSERPDDMTNRDAVLFYLEDGHLPCIDKIDELYNKYNKNLKG